MARPSISATGRPIRNARSACAIYEQRPDVDSVVHNHPYQVVPFTVSSIQLQLIIHVAALGRDPPPTWDIKDKFGDETIMLVTTMEQGRDMCKTLGDGKIVLMRGHGATIAGYSLEDAVMTSIMLQVNAQIQLDAIGLGGTVEYLSQGEIDARRGARMSNRVSPARGSIFPAGRTLMNNLKLSIATTDYDHFRDFRNGAVRAEGIDHNWSMLGHHEVFARFTNREWDVVELSFAKFMAQDHRDDVRHRWLAGHLFAPVPVLVFLCEQKRRHQDCGGSEGQAHRLAPSGRIPPPCTCGAGCTTNVA